MHTTNGGGAGRCRPAAARRLRAIWGSGPTNVYAVSEWSATRHGILPLDKRPTWTNVPLPRGVDSKTSSAASGGRARPTCSSSEARRICHFDGTRWQMMPTPTPLDLLAIRRHRPGRHLRGRHRRRRARTTTACWMQLQPHAGGDDLRGGRGARQRARGRRLGQITELVEAASACGTREAACGNYFDDDCDGVADACDSDCARPAEQCGNRSTTTATASSTAPIPIARPSSGARAAASVRRRRRSHAAAGLGHDGRRSPIESSVRVLARRRHRPRDAYQFATRRRRRSP